MSAGLRGSLTIVFSGNVALQYTASCPKVYYASNTTAKFTGTLFCITDSTTCLFYSGLFSIHCLSMQMSFLPSHLYIWKPFVFVYLSQNGLCQRTLTFQIHPSDPTAAATSVERSLTDNTLSDMGNASAEPAEQRDGGRKNVNLRFGFVSHSLCHILLS